MTEASKPRWMQPGATAVVTGGASGIGLESARRYAQAGMNVVIADANQDALTAAKDELARIGAPERIRGVLCDVADLQQVERLRDTAFEQFGAVHCLMNNAGIFTPTVAPWEDLDQLTATLSVNLWGVIHGCHAFIPAMLKSAVEGAIINTGSKQGITRPPGNYAYNL